MNPRKHLLLLSACLILAGCNMAPKYVRPVSPVPEAMPTGPAYAAEQPEGAVIPADTAWRDFFIDGRLRSVIQTALDNNRDLRVAAANVEQARAQYRIQRADIFPTLAASGSATYEKTPFASNAGTGGGTATGAAGRSDIYSVSAGISAWEIDLFGRLRNLSEAAQQQYFAVLENRNAAQAALIAEVATAWLTMAADQERLRLARETAAAFEKTLQLNRARFEKGVSSDLDVRQAQTSFDQARSDIAEITAQVAQDLNALHLLAGATLAQELLPAAIGDGAFTLDALPANLPSEVLLRRPDIVAAEHELRAANADIGAARAAFFPRISLTAAFGTLSMGLSNLFSGGSDFWSVAPSASLPIFDFGRNTGNLRYAEAIRTRMVAQYERAVQSAFREAADALARRGTIDAQMAAQTSLRDNAREAYRLSEARFRAGIDPFLTTLDSQRAYYAAQRGLVASRLVREANAVELYRALGGGLR